MSLVGKSFEFEDKGIVTVIEEKENHILVKNKENEIIAIYKPFNKICNLEF